MLRAMLLRMGRRLSEEESVGTGIDNRWGEDEGRSLSSWSRT